jgi:3-hydroxyisobutyrate dehydrogenase
MGSGMAARLLESGYAVTVWNRNPARAEALVARGAHMGRTPREAAQGAAVVIAMVADDQASRTIWFAEDGALHGASAGTVLVESSTVSPGWIHELATAADARGCPLLDAPVTGSRTHAASGQLLFLVGGAPAVFEGARPVFAAMGRDARYLGPSGSGARLKLINNFLCGVQAAALAEGLAVIERSGLDREASLAILTEGAPGSPLVKAMAARMTAGDYQVHFALALMRKDLSYAIAEAARLGVALSTATAAREHFDQALAAGFGQADFAAVVEPLRRH